MAKSIGVVLTATAISFGNEWIQTDEINFRIPIAGMGVALLFSGVERLNTRAGVGLAYIMLVTVLLTPVNGNSPVGTLAKWAGGPKVPAPSQSHSTPAPGRKPRSN